ncbi:hypothetical protein BXZ70DRAFT_978150 [Cristinia sonorae]|uniref:RRM domain-containing protein n=1 Tax=Cristinia sonorae TaxID=1940300 RepID=A0A8K0UIH1_9AGAR|nr:hypothetical protein BXZ70DRAFT_978150 [Cristinia sonorae]
MASLIERLGGPADAVGPVRNTKSQRSGGSSPYNRNSRPLKGNSDATWEHDMFKEPGSERSLVSRLTNSTVVPKMNFSLADKALRDATGEKGLSIKGASTRGNVVQVSGLAKGTTASDVEEIFKRCGPVTRAENTKGGENPVIRLTFKHEKDAQAAVAKFHGHLADGKVLEVKIVGGVNASFGGRLGVTAIDNSVDILMEEDNAQSGSKLRSDAILAQDSRATVMLAPPGADPFDYTQRPQRGRGRGGRGRGRGRGGRGKGNGARMDLD